MHYFTEPRDQEYVKGHRFLPFKKKYWKKRKW